MKVFTKFMLLSIFAFTTIASIAQEEKTVTMGASYANEVFYSFQNGVVATPPRNIWDIAFHTDAFSAGIITNDGAGVELYVYPKAANDGWDSFDTTGKSTWPRLYNDVSNWETGAFNRNEKGHPDYGWGVYSMTSHDVIGDSLFLIKGVDGKYRKLNIIRKKSTLNDYEIRFADLDGQNDQSVTLDVSNHESKAFMAYSFNNGIVDREPAKDAWDLLFTRYVAIVMEQPYTVVGVLLNPADTAAEARGVAPDFTDYTSLDYSGGSDVIGHDWKTFDMGTFTYLMEDSLYFFIKAQSGNVYKINFTSFSGSASGTTTFTQELISALAIAENSAGKAIVYPNPAKDQINIITPSNDEGYVRISNLAGKEVMKSYFEKGNLHSVRLNGVEDGIYIVTIVTSRETTTSKIVVVNK